MQPTRPKSGSIIPLNDRSGIGGQKSEYNPIMYEKSIENTMPFQDSKLYNESFNLDDHN